MPPRVAHISLTCALPALHTFCPVRLALTRWLGSTCYGMLLCASFVLHVVKPLAHGFAILQLFAASKPSVKIVCLDISQELKNMFRLVKSYSGQNPGVSEMWWYDCRSSLGLKRTSTSMPRAWCSSATCCMSSPRSLLLLARTAGRRWLDFPHFPLASAACVCACVSVRLARVCVSDVGLSACLSVCLCVSLPACRALAVAGCCPLT